MALSWIGTVSARIGSPARSAPQNTVTVRVPDHRRQLEALSMHPDAFFLQRRVGLCRARWHIVACCALGTFAVAGCRPAQEAPKEEVRPVRVVTIDRIASGDTVSLTGTVQAETEVNLSFRIDGRLIERTVNVGDAIAAGRVIARLDPSNEQTSLQAARSTLAGARAQLAEQRNNFQRQKDLLAQNFISKAAFDVAAANLQSAESAAQSAQAQVELAQNRLSYTQLVADAPGVVTAVNAEAGEVVPAGRMVVQVARKGGRDAVFDVPAQVKDSAPANPEITVVLNTDPRVTAKGRVREVSPRADPRTGTFQVRVGLIDPPETMRLGAIVSGRMRLDARTAMQVPAAAIVRSQKQPAVWIVDPKTQTVSLRNIDVERFDVDRVVVRNGLVAGDIVVAAGAQALRPGQRVRLLEAGK
jgi:RND family efflux transporter MFP subunit